MSWLTYILPYLPPIISIYLVSTSKLTARYLKQLVSSINSPKPEIEQNKSFIEEVALDWGERLGFLNSMIVAIFSCISISSPQTFDWAILTLILLMILFIWMLFWIIPQGAREIVTSYTRFTIFTTNFKMLNSTVCHTILWIVNTILIVEIAIIQYYTSYSVSTPK